MKKEIALTLIAVALIGGFLLGRLFPAHHYETWRNTSLILDTSTGKVCNPLEVPQTVEAAGVSRTLPSGFVPDQPTYVSPCH